MEVTYSLQQFKEKGITIKKGTIQDATFIESAPGHGKHRKGDGTIHSLQRRLQERSICESCTDAVVVA